MKIRSATIKNFRQIEHLELDFTDSLGEVRTTTGIVGPNTSGKTTILDALSLALGQNTELPDSYLRQHLQITPYSIVRRSGIYAEVSCIVEFSADETKATQELFKLSEMHHKVPESLEMKLSWKYPDPQRKIRADYGWISIKPSTGWTLFKGRAYTARLLSTRRLTHFDYFRRVGGIFLFDQQRTGMGKTISQETWQLLGGAENGNGDRYTTDPRTILLDLAIKERFDSPQNEQSDFQKVKEAYEVIAYPHRLLGAERNQLNELELIFTDGQHKYNYSGLSSGEQMLLLYIIKLVTNHVHQSIILIDELELHQHPIWQRKLLNYLPKIGENNQIIYTTHSPYLRDAVNPESIIDLGELGEKQ